MSVQTDLIRIAQAELGTKENPIGSNRTKYGEWFGQNGVAWCAIFLSWVCDRASVKWRFASTVSAMKAAQQAGLWSRTPSVEWAAMRQYTSYTGHIGLVEHVMTDGTVITTEGNTNDAGSREGDGVYRKRRSASWWSGYINLPALAVSPPVPPQPSGVTIYVPPLNLQPIVSSAKDPVAGGSWLLGQDGSIYAFDGARYLGGPNGKPYFAGRTAARLEITADGLYCVVATSGEKYGPGF